MSRSDASRRYEKSNNMRARAEKVIPLGSQTFSKSHIQFPTPQAPLYVVRGQGGRVWDVDGNEYVDLISGLLPVLLGYRDPDVDEAIRRQLERGITFSLASELEVALAERLVALVPCAEMVRFGKNGSDATSAAVRLARAFTGRDHIIALGYHGWQDWYIGATTRAKGVPEAVRALTLKVPYHDMPAIRAAFEAHEGDVAAIILEPMFEDVEAGYLQALVDYARQQGALVIFDEVVTGFRYARGGAQELFGVTPDLAAFGKAMGNGMPISAVLGRGDVMMEMEEIFFSSTFGGECLSLAAAIAVVDKLKREPVVEHLWRFGEKLATGVAALVARHGLDEVISLGGLPPWKLLQIQDYRETSKFAIKTLLIKELLRRGVITNGGHNICYAHNEADMAQVLDAYDQALQVVARELERPGLEQRLDVKPIRPVFRVR